MNPSGAWEEVTSFRLPGNQLKSLQYFWLFSSTGTSLIFHATAFFSFPYLYLIHTLYYVKMVKRYLFPAKILKLTRSVIFSWQQSLIYKGRIK